MAGCRISLADGQDLDLAADLATTIAAVEAAVNVVSVTPIGGVAVGVPVRAIKGVATIAAGSLRDREEPGNLAH